MGRAVRVLVVGICTRPLAWSARRNGDADVVGLDYFGDRDQREAGETYALEADFGLPLMVENLARAAATIPHDAVAYSASLENHSDMVARLAGRATLLGNSPATLRRVRHLPTLARVCRGAGIAYPPTLLRHSPPRGEAWLHKPRLAGGGHGIRPWVDGDGPPRRGTALQRHIPGRPISATFVANGAQAVLVGLAEGLAGLSQFGASGYTYCGSIVPPGGAPGTWVALLPRLTGIVTALTRAFGLVGLNGVDLIAGPSEHDITLLEVNPRHSASMELIERLYGAPLFRWHVRAITERALPRFDLGAALRQRGDRWAKAIMYARGALVVGDTAAWAAHGVRDVPHSHTAIPDGAPLCTVLYHGDGDNAALLEGLAERAAWVLQQGQLAPAWCGERDDEQEARHGAS